MIRKARFEDAEALQEIISKNLGYVQKIDLIRNQLKRLMTSDTYVIFVYTNEKEEVMGYVEAEFYECLYSEAGLNVLGLAVNKSCRGRGIGRLLMERLEKFALDKQLSFIRLNSGSKRVNAHKFYETLGYQSNHDQKRFMKNI